jgi:hypothetical protein
MRLHCHPHNLTMLFRAIYHGLGCADDPDVDDYYTKARGFPLTYSPDEDPEVIEEMKIAKAELDRGAGDEDDEGADEGLSGDSETDDEEGDENDGEIAGEWEDESDEADDEDDGQPKKKRKRKVLSCVDKVRV